VQRRKKDALKVSASRCKSSLQSSQQQQQQQKIRCNFNLLICHTLERATVDGVGRSVSWDWPSVVELLPCYQKTISLNQSTSLHFTLPSTLLYFSAVLFHSILSFFIQSRCHFIMAMCEEAAAAKKLRTSVHIKNLIKVHLVGALWLLPPLDPRPCHPAPLHPRIHLHFLFRPLQTQFLCSCRRRSNFCHFRLK